MNEIEIYYKIKEQIKKIQKITFPIFIITSMLLALAISYVFIMPIKNFLFYMLIFSPSFILLGFFVFFYIKEYKLAKKYMPIYKNIYNDSFVEKVRKRSFEIKQINDAKIRIKNNGLEYLDEIFISYKNDKQKMSNAIYNAILYSSFIEEIEFYEKYKKFVKDMKTFRNDIL